MRKLYKLLSLVSKPSLLSALFGHRVAASTEHIAVMRSLDCRTVVDIGANRGQFALAARYCFPGAVIFSFEPLEAPARIFQSVFKHDKSTVLFNSAVGPSESVMEMHVSRRDDSSSLLPITERQNSLFPGTSEARKSRINIARLATLLSGQELSSPSLLKLDVQGFELQALYGCEALLQQFDWVYVECSFIELYEAQALAGEVVEWLGERGFRLTGVYNVSYDSNGLAIQADFLFARRGLR